VRLVVASAAGSNADIVARLLAAALEEAHGQRFLVENIPTASGTRAVEQAARAAADGHTLLFGTASQLVMNLALFPTAPGGVDVERDVRGVAMVNRVPMALAVPPGEPAADLPAFVARLRAEGPARFQYGSGPRGTTTHIVGALFAERAGLAGVVHVPYQSSAQALTDLGAGRLTFMFDALVTALPAARGGLVRLLGVASEARVAAAPELPTLAERGLPGFVGATWNTVAAPTALPDPLAEAINAAVAAALARPDLRRRLADLGGKAEAPVPPAGVDAFYRAERALWLPVLRAAIPAAGG
jgi:tripartite-type tricarboxylate transporter receptor subunit TctC